MTGPVDKAGCCRFVSDMITEREDSGEMANLVAAHLTDEDRVCLHAGDIRDVAFFLSTIVFFVFANVVAVEHKKND